MNKRILEISGTVDNIQHHGTAFGFGRCSPSSDISAMQCISEPLPGADAFQCHLLAVDFEDGTSGMTSQALGQERFAEVVRLRFVPWARRGDRTPFFILQRWIIGCGLWAMSRRMSWNWLADTAMSASGEPAVPDSMDLRAGISVCRTRAFRWWYR